MVGDLDQLLDIAATASGCVLWPAGLDRKGYGVIRRGRRSEKVHRVVLELRDGIAPPSGSYVRHTCTIKHCIQPSHLYVDHRERSSDTERLVRERRREQGRIRKGNTLFKKTIEQGRLHNGTAEANLWRIVEASSYTDECVLWTYGRDSKGYGVIKINKRMERVHRYVWHILNRQKVPSGVPVKHVCKNKNCVQPRHLFLGY